MTNEYIIFNLQEEMNIFTEKFDILKEVYDLLNRKMIIQQKLYQNFQWVEAVPRRSNCLTKINIKTFSRAKPSHLKRSFCHIEYTLLS